MNIHEQPKTGEAGDEINVRLTSLGECPDMVDGKTVVRRFGARVLPKVEGNYSGEILMDYGL